MKQTTTKFRITDIMPAHTTRPGTEVRSDGVIFSVIFHDCKSCGLILYHLPDGESIRIPFTDEYRLGSLYSVFIKGLDPQQIAYRYYRDAAFSSSSYAMKENKPKEDEIVTFRDPYARELIELTSEGQTVTACRLFHQREDALLPYTKNNVISWNDELIYVCHLKGLTASSSSKVAHKGTYLGLTEKIPYLKSLGITAVELLPIYELRPNPRALSTSKNYWGFGEGYYFAPKASFAVSSKKKVRNPQREFGEMVDALHQENIKVYLQLCFTKNVSIQTQLESARFYVTHYHVDGFHLKGDAPSLGSISSDPILSRTAIFYYSFPYEELQKEDTENPAVGKPSVTHLCEYTDDFSRIVRRFVKSDNNVIRDFAKQFTSVPQEHGSVHFVTNYDGFTLNDLVTYNWKHNEANGEEGRDGTDDNLSWNCGIEGKSGKKEIRSLRLRQMKNFMALNFFAQGTPVLTAGDERCNTQGGNNNPYNQDNETTWVSWKENADSKNLLAFTRELSSYRMAHGVFRQDHSFRMNDYKVTGYPDLSFHGRDAWKPDFSGYSHTLGVLYDERYAEKDNRDALLYLAINMHWHNQPLGLPTPPEGFHWQVVMDTFEEHSFLEKPRMLEDPRHVSVRGRSICLLEAVPNVVMIKTPTATVAPVSYFQNKKTK